MTDLHKLKVVDLKKMLKDNNLPVTGTKPELISRLEALNDIKDSTINTATEKTELIDADILLEEDATVSSTITSVPVVLQPPKIEKITMPKSMTNGIEDRIKRFGPVSTEAQKTLREKRFSNGSQPAAKLNNKVNMNDVLKLREERFASKTTVTDKAKTLPESNDILVKRANRFGIDSAQNSVKKNDAAALTSTDAKLKRAERFKINSTKTAITATSTTATTASTKNDGSAILKRKGRFGIIIGPTDASEEKKSKRLERFGLM